MVIIQWRDDYRTGIPAVDDDHRGLVDRLNRLVSSVRSGASARRILPLMDDLIAFTEEHFSREEHSLDKGDYPGLAGHVAQHQRLLEQMRHFRKDYKDGLVDRDLTRDATDFLSRWLIKHIVDEDLRCGAYLKRLV